MKCKHNWGKAVLKKGNKWFGKETQYRRCKLCGHQERLEENISTGRKHWVAVGG